MSEAAPIDWPALSDDELVTVAHREIWLSGFCKGGQSLDAFKNSLAAFDEAERRGKPDLYTRAWNRAERGGIQ